MSLSYTSVMADIAAADRRSPALRAGVFTRTSLVGPRPALAATAGTAVAASFMVTNRTWSSLDWPIPLPGGRMVWSMSVAQGNDPDPANYAAVGDGPTAEAPTAFLDAVVDVVRKASNRLTLFVHGLGNHYASAIAGTAALGTNLAAFAGYPGLVMGFHWPSYGEFASGLYYATSDAFPPEASEGSIRDNINGSRPAFANLLAFLRQIRRAVPGLSLSLICHSEGNYMAMLGFLGSVDVQFEHILLLAADINDGALQVPGPRDARAGRGLDIARSAGAVTVYYTGNDDILPLSLYAYEKDYHNRSFGGRLGSAGPSYAQGPQADNMLGVDCAGVINVANFTRLIQNGSVPSYADGGELSMHTSYLYIPQVVRDMGKVIAGVPAGEIPDRTANPWPGSYTMALDDDGGATAAAGTPRA